MTENNSANTVNPFDTLRVDREHQDQSLEWFMQKIKSLNRSTYQPNALLRSQKHKIANPVSGKMYMYLYDPVHKDTLPFYDTVPVVFFLNWHPDPKFRKTHYYCLNLHFLNPKMRLALLRRLYTVANTTRFDATKRLRITWEIVSRLSSSAGLGAQNCIKMYRIDAMKSQFLEIPSSSWTTLALLDISRFYGASKEKIWLNSKRNR